ncbi:hypothetical protein [Nonomuraea typhae]|uniref:hypothetical protein n=1 Tax=Nonomuraea typhae TaxID=2603600 RepID=UPI0012FCD9AD|nr:hypothetical protein [Nonomuraea typhae]
MRDYPHGTLGRYLSRRCRCQLCRGAKAAYSRQRKRLIAYGRWESYVDAAECRAHVESLLSSGITLGRVAVLAGISVSTVKRLMHGIPRSGGQPSEKVKAETARALLAVQATLDDLPDTAWIDAIGTRRRAQALAVLGHSFKDQADAIGKHATNYRRLLCTPTVLVGTARLVRSLYDAWSMTPAPSNWKTERTRRWASQRGWLPPLAWDDDLIDLAQPALEAALRERVESMPMEDLQHAHNSRYRHGDKTPLTLEASREYKRRQKAAGRELGEAS